MPQDNVSTLQSAVPATIPGPYRLHERRRHKRHASQQLKLTFLGAEHEPVSWSLAGFLVADRHPHTPIGTAAAGFLTVWGHKAPIAIAIELVRRDKKTREIAFRFVDPSRALLDALSELVEHS
jgi:hypothetical protein